MIRIRDVGPRMLQVLYEAEKHDRTVETLSTHSMIVGSEIWSGPYITVDNQINNETQTTKHKQRNEQ